MPNPGELFEKSGQPPNDDLHDQCRGSCPPQFRKLTKTKDGFANEDSLLKLPDAGILKTSE